MLGREAIPNNLLKHKVRLGANAKLGTYIKTMRKWGYKFLTEYTSHSLTLLHNITKMQFLKGLIVKLDE